MWEGMLVAGMKCGAGSAAKGEVCYSQGVREGQY